MNKQNETNFKFEYKVRNHEEESSKLIRDLTESRNKFTNDYELWLDKYKPYEYVDLLTEEKSTREILSWIKSWDEIVYGKKFELLRNSLKVDKNINEFQAASGNNYQNNLKKDKEIDYTMVKYKIILIAGPPGMGKTTLAKVLANHCKYEPIVINASDERTSEKLLLRIYDSTQLDKLKFNKKFGDKEKPTCLILDEIDGAMDGLDGKNAVKSIIDFIKFGKQNKNVLNKDKKNILSQNNLSSVFSTAQPDISISNNNIKDKRNEKNNLNYESSDDEKERPFGSKRKKEDDEDIMANESKNVNKNMVKRPIICICNDLYSKVLSQLRKEALVFNIKADPIKLEKRLKEICKKEKLNIDGNILKNLCKQTNYDIRACINSLQFLSYNQNNKDLFKSLGADKLYMLGCKDITAGLFDIWNKIFTFSPMEATFNKTWMVYNSYGEFDKINEGLFVNYISNPISIERDELSNRVKLLEFLSNDDIITSRIKTTHNYELTKFHVLPGAYAKSKYSTTERNKNLKFPSLFIEYKKNKKNNSRIFSEIKETFHEETPFVKLTKKSLICDVLPYIYQLIQPEIREINTELMNKIELKQLKTAVNIMCSFGIKFKDNKSEEEDNEKLYEPDIKQLLDFNFKADSLNENNFYGNNKNKNYNSSSLYKNDSVVVDINNTRITRRQTIIVRSEYERIKNYKENIKEKKPRAIGIASNMLFNANINKSNIDENVKEIKEKVNKINFFEPMSKKVQALSSLSENKNFGGKRNYSQFSDPEIKFVYKYNEGVTNTVRRNLNINYFLSN